MIWRWAAAWIGALGVACSPPIEDDRCFPERCGPEALCVNGRCAPTAPPDGAAPGDAAPADAGPAAPDCTPLRPLASPPPLALWASELELLGRFGQPPPPDGFDTVDLDGDGLADTVAALGGVVEASGAAGALWATPVDGVTALAGVADLNGDGRVEVVAYGASSLALLDGLTGRTLWREALPQRKALSDLARFAEVTLGPPALDGRRPVWITHPACFDGQRPVPAQPHVLWFDGQQAQEVEVEPLAAGVCRFGPVFGRPGPEGQLGALVPEPPRSRLLQIDPRTGQRRWCGQLRRGSDPDLRVAELLPDRRGLEVLAVDAEGWQLFAAVEGRWPDCDAEGAVGPARVDFTDLASTDVAVLDADGDGRPELAVTEDNDGVRVVVQRPDPRAGEDAVVGRVDNARVLGDGFTGDDVLVELLPVNAPAARLGDVMRFTFEFGESRISWRAPVGSARPARRRLQGRAARGAELVWLRAPAGRRLLLEQDLDGDFVADRLVTVDVDGQQAAWSLPDRLVGVRVVCDPAACGTTDTLRVLTADGRSWRLTPTLEVQAAKRAGGPLDPVAGPVHLQVSPGEAPRLVVTVPARGRPDVPQRVISQDPFTGERWSADLDTQRPPPVFARPGGPPVVMVRSTPGPDVVWSALDVGTGAEVWRHAVRAWAGFQARLRRLEWPDGAWVLRVDEAEPGQPGPCPRAALPPPAQRDCGLRPQTRLVTALDLDDGACRWELAYELTDPCARDDALEGLSVVQGPDGPELYLAESTALHRLAPDTGEVLYSVSLPPPAQGGQVLAHPRAGQNRVRAGAGPLDLWGTDLGALPSPDEADAGAPVAEAALGPEALWFHRDGALRLAQHDGDTLVVSAAAITDGALGWGRGGAPVRSLTFARGLARDGADGVVAATATHLVGLAPDLDRAWARTLPAPGAPWVGDLDGDGALDWAQTLGDGRVMRGARRALAAPSEVRVVPCPVDRACEGERPAPVAALDTDQADHVCAVFRPVAEADAHEARLVGEDGLPLSGWAAAGQGVVSLPLAQARPGLDGVAHGVEVRAWADRDGRRQTSAPGRSAPVRVRDRAAPQGTLSVVGGGRQPAGAPVTFLLDAQDDHALASRRLEIADGAGAVVWASELGPFAEPAWSAALGWDGQGGEPLGPLAPGDYEARLIVGDVAGQTGRAVAPLVLCAGACE